MNSREGSKKKERGSEQDNRETDDGLNVDPPSGASVCRCWGRSTSSGGRRTGVAGRDRGRSGTHGLGTESLEGVGSARFSVDGEHHSAGTVVTLSTINPNRAGVIHGDGESGEVGDVISNGFARREVRSMRHPFSEGTTHNPDLKPLVKGLQGSPKVD